MDHESSERKRTDEPTKAGHDAVVFWITVVCVALAVRGYLFAHYYTINNDGVLYIEAARHFWEGRWGEALDSFYPPLFPLLIAAAYPAAGEWELAGQMWPIGLGLLAMAPLYGLLRQLYGDRAARWALLFYAVSPYLARYSLHVRSEIPYIFFLILAAYLFERGRSTGGRLAIFGSGASAGLSYLTRSEGLGLVVVGLFFLLCWAWRSRQAARDRRAVFASTTPVFAFLLGFVVVAAPYVGYLRADTGRWLVSRKAGLILHLALAEHDVATDEVTMESSDRVGLINLVAGRPRLYVEKVSRDAFRSLGVYFEALHYPFAPFVVLGWILFFRRPFRRRGDSWLFVLIGFHVCVFAFLYVNRRYAVPLVPLSLGWTAVGFLAAKDFFRARWPKNGVAVTVVMTGLLIGSTLPKALAAIGREKLHLKQAGLYLKTLPGRPAILTTNGRVGFYARGDNSVRTVRAGEFGEEPARSADYLAVDQSVYDRRRAWLEANGWTLERTFSREKEETLGIFRRQRLFSTGEIG
jgi:4-amino-4-deoxy-L-arabinose transferase-like glycosyltransferase